MGQSWAHRGRILASMIAIVIIAKLTLTLNYNTMVFVTIAMTMLLGLTSDLTLSLLLPLLVLIFFLEQCDHNQYHYSLRPTRLSDSTHRSHLHCHSYLHRARMVERARHFEIRELHMRAGFAVEFVQ